MRIPSKHLRREEASVLAIALVIGTIMVVVLASCISLSSAALRSAHGRADWNQAFYDAENALVWAAQNVADSPPRLAAPITSRRPVAT